MSFLRIMNTCLLKDPTCFNLADLHPEGSIFIADTICPCRDGSFFTSSLMKGGKLDRMMFFAGLKRGKTVQKACVSQHSSSPEKSQNNTVHPAYSLSQMLTHAYKRKRERERQGASQFPYLSCPRSLILA